jgi:hypothetical protein
MQLVTTRRERRRVTTRIVTTPSTASGSLSVALTRPRAMPRASNAVQAGANAGNPPVGSSTTCSAAPAVPTTVNVSVSPGRSIRPARISSPRIGRVPSGRSSKVRAQVGFGGPFDAPLAVADTASNETTYAPVPTPESVIRSVNALPRGAAVSHRPSQR